MIKALILDLDNTIFRTQNIAEKVFKDVFPLMDQYRGDLSGAELEQAKVEMSRTPVQKLASQYGFPAKFTEQAIAVLNTVIYDQPITPYKDYAIVRAIKLPKFLVTFGFKKLQESKVDCLGIRSDFKEVIVVDPEQTSETKRDVFEKLMAKYGYGTKELLAVGDDPDSEIKAARDLGIPTYLYDPESRFKSGKVTYHEQSYRRLPELL